MSRPPCQCGEYLEAQVNILRDVLRSSEVRSRARDTLRQGMPIDIKFLAAEVPLLEQASNGLLSNFVNSFILPAVSTAELVREWDGARQSSSLPTDQHWIEAVDLIDDRTLLFPDDADASERILGFTSTIHIDLLTVVGLEFADGQISLFWARNPPCYHRDNGIKCAGICRDGQPCTLVSYVGYGPRRAYCEC
jgi:hypothetical protein